jgi:hypothetical protein
MTATSKARRASLGVRCHSGWAAAILLAGPPKAPTVLERCRIALCAPPLAKQPFHEAEAMPFEAAQAYIGRCMAASAALACEAVMALAKTATARRFALTRCGIVAASGRPLPELGKVLASHALIHAAEGEFYRDAVAQACAQMQIASARVKERELADWLGARVPDFEGKIAEWGRELGPPWTADQKLAAQAAWLALASG